MRPLTLISTTALAACAAGATSRFTSASATVAPLALDSTIVSGVVGRQLDSLMRHLEDSSFAGTVLVAIGDKPVLLKGYGYADVSRRILNGPTTLFDFASITKTLTGAAILELDATKRLDVRHPVSEYVGGVAPAKVAQA